MFLFGLLFTSCKKYVEGEDISPNAPSNVTEGLLLSGLEVSTFSNYTGNLARIGSVMSQQSAGVLFQYEDLQKYDINETTIDNEWGQIYNRSLVNADLLIEKAGNINKQYRGIARILKAMNLGLATDYWGDVPNKEALQGLNASYNSAFDTQESIIADIQQTLTDAIADLKSTTDVLTPGTDDYIFGGDASKWIMNAYVLKARYANRLSKIDPSGSATAALSSLNDAYNAGYISSANNMKALFGQNANEYNQWFGFNQDRAGYMTMGAPLMTMMNNLNDPRLPFYATKDANGGYSDGSSIGALYGSSDSPLPLVTFVEAKFIEAEAHMRLGHTDEAAAAHNAAVVESVIQVTGANDAAYAAAQASETMASITMTKIMSQKYIAMFTQPEAWADWRRTNIPALTPNANGIIAGIPRRLPTAQQERLYNTKAVVTSDLLKPVWWDK